VLARWRDDESVARRMAVLARWRDDKSAAGRTTVLAHWRDKELAVGRTMVLTRLCDDGVDGRADNGDSSSSAVPCSLVRQRVGDGANGGARSLVRRRVSGGADSSAHLPAQRGRYDESVVGRMTVLALWRTDSQRQGGRLEEHPQRATIDVTINSVWSSGSRTACCRPREC